jgi:Ca-activated chloride channel homolog
MNRATRWGTTALALSLAMLSPPAATARPEPLQDEVPAGQIGRTEVVVPVSVFGKDGKWVSGLTRANFRIYEDGKEQTIAEFESPTQLPLQVAVLMDTSSSVKRKLKFQQDAAYSFVTSVIRKSGDRALYATFDSQVSLRTDFTRNTTELTRAIDASKAGGNTRMFDAVYRVCEEKMMDLPGQSRGVLVVISDGVDTESDRSLEEAIEMAQRANVTIFGISTRNYSDINAGIAKGSVDKELDRLCVDTGGRTFLPYERIELERAFQGISETLTKQYVIFYEPQNTARDGKFRRIKVEVTGFDGKADVRAKKGYYAPSQNSDVVPR